jgi:hypothetical protein
MKGAPTIIRFTPPRAPPDGIRLSIEDGSSSSTDTLVCPRCDEDGGLHHDTVTVYDRSEDDARTIVTTCDGRQTTMAVQPSHGLPNPSARRHGLTIGFRCEHCGDGLVLTIAQHKGATLLHWRVA